MITVPYLFNGFSLLGFKRLEDRGHFHLINCSVFSTTTELPEAALGSSERRREGVGGGEGLEPAAASR